MTTDIAVPEPERAPWEKQKGESRQSFANFAHYRDLGPTRTLAEAAADLGKSAGHIEQQSAKYDWQERCDAYDLFMDRRTRERNETLLGQRLEVHAGIGRALQGAALTKLAGRKADEKGEGFVEALDPNLLEPADVVRFAAEGIRQERLALGQPTEFLKGALGIRAEEATRIFGLLLDECLKLLDVELQPVLMARARAIVDGSLR